ncbi:FAD-dependent monooxygenase [Geodermatophilus sp. YIM 151500]|uniref:FAD binding domain-containing protein n=1 Tax=Geodermatophilus sp. YIM 151500 TaxID=2984531 RepID=UPI0021E4000E|nr:FAD-dependent monooxygenase [Geodermatophilus sp. YIM 151500]MCV2488847.1 FAD-dependent monooxygenase [Geodermatophilus sp. YIM 151500]
MTAAVAGGTARETLPADRRPRVAVLGGSLIGLTTALVLRDIGCDVDVFERSRSPLEGRGVGIVLHPATVRYLLDNRLLDLSAVSTTAAWHRYLDVDGSVLAQAARRHHFTGYNTLYGTLLQTFGRDRYHLGAEATGVRDDGDRVEVAFADGRTATADLLVGADGVSSFVRRTMLPGVRPGYGGYVAWRGVVDERELAPETFAALDDALTYHVQPHTHVLTYPIPHYDGGVAPGRRLMNVVWYRNVAEGRPLDELLTDREGRRRDVSLPPGAARDEVVAEVRSTAAATLPPPIAEVVVKNEAPFLQVMVDVDVPRMAFGRTCLVGDAAFAVRPHAAAATAKGAEDVWALADALLRAGGDVPAALAAWEPARLEVGRALLARTRELGEGAQFRNDWVPGDPALTFGLHRPGDSADMRVS